MLPEHSQVVLRSKLSGTTVLAGREGTRWGKAPACSRQRGARREMSAGCEVLVCLENVIMCMCSYLMTWII